MGYAISTGVWDVANSSVTIGIEGTLNTGRAFHAGDSSADTLSSLAPGSQVGQHHGSKVIKPSDVLNKGGPTGILAAGNFASMTEGSYVMKRVTTSLAGVSNTFLRSGASDTSSRRSIHKVETVRTWLTASSIRAGDWNIFTGSFSSAVSTSEDSSDFGVDDAAVPSGAVPGELVYHYGSGAPLMANYPSRTIW